MESLRRAAPSEQARGRVICAGRASFYDTEAALSPIRLTLLGQPFFGRRIGRFGRSRPGQMRRPEVGAAGAGEPLGLRAAPSRDLGVVAGTQHVRDRTALPELRPRILRIFEQALGEALLLPGGFLPHDAGQEPDAGVEQDESGDLPA